MRILEYFLLGISLTGLFFKSMHWPGASLLLIFGLAGLSIFYFLFGWAHFSKIGFRKMFKKESYTGIPAIELVGKFFVGWGLSTLTIGILFWIMRWPGARVMIIAGMAQVGLCLLIALVYFFVKKHTSNWRLLTRGCGYGVFAIWSLYFFLGPQEILLDYTIDPNYIEARKKYEEEPSEQNFLMMNLAEMYASGDTLGAQDYEIFIQELSSD